MGRPVAVKILRATLLDGTEAEQRFLREAEVLAALDHRAVVSVHDRGRTEEQDLFLVMDLIGGQPLSGLLDEAENRGEAPRIWVRIGLGKPWVPRRSPGRVICGWWPAGRPT